MWYLIAVVVLLLIAATLAGAFDKWLYKYWLDKE